MFKLSDLIQNTAAVAAAASPSQFAMHALDRDDQGLLTYTKALWSNTAESIQIDNGQGLAYDGIEEFISGYTPSGVLHNSIDINVDESGSKTRDSETFYIRVVDANTANPKFSFNGVVQERLILKRGATYTFNTDDQSTKSFPLYISTANVGANYSNEWANGVTYSRSANDSVSSTLLTSNNDITPHALVFTVPFDAPSMLYYASGTNANCVGPIEIHDPYTNLKYRRYEQVRFDNQQLSYYINSEGYLVARYGA